MGRGRHWTRIISHLLSSLSLAGYLGSAHSVIYIGPYRGRAVGAGTGWLGGYRDGFCGLGLRAVAGAGWVGGCGGVGSVGFGGLSVGGCWGGSGWHYFCGLVVLWDEVGMGWWVREKEGS
jgi:hypothetical protein